MATTTTTMAMDAMIDSLKETSLMVHEITSQADLTGPGAELPTLRPMVFTESTLCSACKAMLCRVDRTSRTTNGTDELDLPGPSSYRNEEFPHHCLEDLSKEAVQGCHLCLVVYLSLDSEALGDFARSLTTNVEPSSSRQSPNGFDSGPSSNVGIVRFTPLSTEEAKLSFRYFKAPTKPSNMQLQRQSLHLGDTMKSYLVASFDFANFESQRASIGYLLGDTAGGMPPVSYLQTEAGISEVATSISSEDASLCVELTLINPQHALDLGVRAVSSDSVSTGSDESFEIAKGWIRKCTEHHLSCMASAGAKYRPSYLLDVSIKDSKRNAGIKLVDGMLLDRRSEYITLSHAWGPSKPIRLHSKTLPALRQGIARSNLPKTLSDAAMVTEKLGYKYLWVDALCIMHDNEQGVLNEISQMHKIYGNAALNIAATCAWADNEGFIRPRNVAAIQPCVLDVRGHAIDDGTYMVIRPTAWTDSVDKAPLQKRAWVLQERALARRTLHFTRNELMWECREMCCSEVHPRGFPVESDTSRASNVKNSTSSSNPFDKPIHHQKVGNWSQLVEVYSIGKLSFPSDKLLAISSLARQYRAENSLTESDYVAGLWCTDLPQALLWNVSHGQRSSRYRAPTWSWASIDGPVQCSRTDLSETQVCLEVNDVHIDNRHGDAFGLCQSATVEVCGFLALGTLQRRRAYWGETSCSIQFPRARVRVDFQEVNFDEELPVASFETLEVHILPVLCTTNQVQGLLIVSTEVKGEFKRLGTFTLPMENNKANCEKFKIVMKGDHGLSSYPRRPDQTSGSFWFAGAHRYIITLV